MPSQLFSPITLAGTTFDNRLVISPMCQYSADEGLMNDWHTMHLGTLANSGCAPQTRIASEASGSDRQ